MPNKQIITFLHNLIFGVSMCCLTNCAIGTTKITLSHDPLPDPPQRQAGIIKVEKFADTRPTEKGGEYIGYKRNVYGMTVGRVGATNQPIDTTITNFFIEALKNTGYTVIYNSHNTTSVTDNTLVPILTGKISSCWMDMYMAADAQIIVELDLYDAHKQNLLWQSVVYGEDSNVLVKNAASEFEEIYKRAFTCILDTAQQEFSTITFLKKINSNQE